MSTEPVQKKRALDIKSKRLVLQVNCNGDTVYLEATDTQIESLCRIDGTENRWIFSCSQHHNQDFFDVLDDLKRVTEKEYEGSKYSCGPVVVTVEF